MKHTHSLKRVLSFIMALAMILSLCPVTAHAANYYVAGEPAAVFGSTWDASSAANKMTPNKYSDTHLYYKIYQNVASGTINFKVTNGSWSTSWPGSDYSFSVPSGKNIVVIRFDTNTSTVTPYAISNFIIAGNAELCGEGWAPTNTANAMTYNSATKLHEKVYENVPAGTHSLKVTAGNWDACWGGSGGNYTFTVAKANSTVKVTFDPATLTVNTVVTAPPAVYNVALNGTNVEISGNSTVTEKTEYTATVIAKDGYTLPETVKVTVGDTEITNFTYVEGVVTIPPAAVTGNISISATGVEIVEEPTVYDVTLESTTAVIKSVTKGDNYVIVIEPKADFYAPASVTVVVGSTTISNYTYKVENGLGTVTIPSAEINGNVQISGNGDAIPVIRDVVLYGEGVTFTSGDDSVTEKAAYTAAFSLEDGYEAPVTATVTMVSGDDTVTLTQGTDYTFALDGNDGTVTISEGKITGNINITVKATKKVVAPATATVYFQNNWKWSDVRIYAWDSNEDPIIGGWPGTPMTFVEYDGTYDIYSAEIPVGVSYLINGIKDDGSGNLNQTPDINEIYEGKAICMKWDNGNAIDTFDYTPSSGGETPDPTPEADYYLVGYINGENHGDGDDYANLGDYPLVDGTLTTTFTADSYVCVKSSDNKTWYMTDGWLGTVESATLYASGTLGEDANKLPVPGGVEVTFTLAENDNGTLTLSYKAKYDYTADQSGIQDGLTLHAWNWSFDNITANLDLIKSQGYTAVQTSPIQPLKEATKAVAAEKWWLYYQPVDFVITADTDEGNALGTLTDFQELCAAAEDKGIKIIVDVVANHLANDEGNDLSPEIPASLRDTAAYWHDITVDTSVEDYENGNRQGITQKCMGGLPDLNTANKEVQNYVINFLKACVDAGADGFRFDAAKHIETPYDAEAFASDFWPNVIGAVKAYKSGLYFYGETLDALDKIAVHDYAQYMSVLDNAWSNNLRNEIVSGKADTLTLGYFKVAPASKLVLWAESHDTYGNKDKVSTNISEKNINKTWALVAARKDAMGLYLARPESLTSTLLGEAAVTGWANPEVKAVNNFRNTFKAKAETVGTTSNVAYVVRGDSGAVLVKLSGSSDVSVALGLTDGTYYDQITGNVFTVTGGTAAGTIGSTDIAVLTTTYVEPPANPDPDPTPDPEPTTKTIYFRNDWLWTDICVYAWDSNGAPTVGAWPGKAMTYLETLDGKDIYSAEIPADTVNFKFSGMKDDGSGRDESNDLTNPSSSVVYYMFYEEDHNVCKNEAYTPGNGSNEPSTPAGPTYIIAGNDADIFGAAWDPANTANQMVLNETSGLYEKTYENVPIGSYTFKVTNGSWSQSWGAAGSSADYSLSIAAISNVTIQFNDTTKLITVVVTPTGAIQETVTDVTIHYRNTGLWDTVNGYIWTLDTKDLMNGEWPGSEIEADKDHINWYTIQLTEQNAPAGIGFIFNNGTAQTPDIKITANGEYWYDGELLTEEPDNFADGSVPMVKYKASLHFANAANWTGVKLYTWTENGTTLTGGWPGTAAAQGADGFYSMDVVFEAPEGQGLNYIFSGDGQTVDLKLEAKEFKLVDGVYTAEKWLCPDLGNTDTDGKYNVTTADNANAIAVSPIIDGSSVTFQYKNADATSVKVYGTMSNDSWQTGYSMTPNEYGVWSVTIENVTPAIHRYKFNVEPAPADTNGWITDPMNGFTYNEEDHNVNSAFLISDPKNDKNEITIRIHYAAPSKEWNVCAWGVDGLDSQYDFVDGVATIEKINGRQSQYVAFKIRKSTAANKWAEQSKEFNVDLSRIVSGTLDLYIDGANGNWTSFLGLNEDIVYDNKIYTVDLNYDNGTILVKTNQAVEKPEEELVLVNVTTGAAVDAEISSANGVNVIKPAEGVDINLVNLHEYQVKFDGYTYPISLNSVYASDKFAAEYTYAGNDLGATWTSTGTTFKVWAPTAESVQVQLYATGSDAENGAEKLGIHTMKQDVNGTWTVTVEGDLSNVYYTYIVKRSGKTVEAVDPYARATGVNGERAMVLSLDSTDPEGWSSDKNPNPVTSQTDAIIYELHVRDFSIDESSGVSENNRGKYLAFTEEGTTTSKGTSTGIDYLDELGITHLHLLPVYDYGSVDETKCENFNWGYDPVNYNVPEGSYSTNPYDGDVRINEFKQMVMSLHEHDISVVMDVVYNHVYDAGAFSYNQIVPNYFSRTNPDGSYSSTSGCGNDTASEREMVRKYIVESVLYWHQEYHIDGFRFDLVGLLDAQTIKEVVETVHACCPDVIFYGEGWDMDGTAREPGTAMAKQHNADLTPGFAYFSDSMRNLIAGDNGNSTGFVSGATGKEYELIDNVLAKASSWGKTWTTNPQQVVQYVSCHDNYTLMDKLIISTGKSSMDNEVVKMNNLSAAIYMTSQGISFIHAGEELLREKIENGVRNHNSYNSSDEVNKIRWDNLDKDLYANTSAYYQGLIAFRKAHSALRLDSSTAIGSYVTSKKLTDNAVQFTIDGMAAGDISDKILVIYNANKNPVQVSLDSGDWSVCIDDQAAGNKALRTVSGSVNVAGISAMVLVQGTVCEHSFTDRASNQKVDDATCTSAATYYAQCDYCDEVSTDKIVTKGKSNGHSYTENKASGEKATDADCVDPATYYVQCDNCDHVNKDLTPVAVGNANEHSYTENKASNEKASAADCVNPATYYVQCDNCDHVNKDLTPVAVGKANEHSYTNKKPSSQKATNADCTNPATYYVQCDNCDYVSKDLTVKVGDTNEHSFVAKASATKATDATCTAAATYYVQCDNCNVISNTLTVPVGKANEHSFTTKASATKATDATCTAAATYYVQCNNCDEVSKDKTVSVGLPASHSYNSKASSQLATAATCEKAATYYVQCDNCTNVTLLKTVSVGEPAKHNYENGTCTGCGASDPDYVAPSEPAESLVVRVYGEDRFETAFKVADELKATLGVDKFQAVIIASGADFADALTGSYLANVKGAPILLSYKAEQNLQVVNYVRQNLVAGGTVYILGGNAAVPTAMDLLFVGYNVKRLSGETRFETNLAILKEAGVKDGQEILVCTATNFADSLSASATGLPILLVYNEKSKLTDSQKEYLATLKDCTFTIIGGHNAVSLKTESAVALYGKTTRHFGANRYETSVGVANRYFTNPDYAILAYGTNYPDGLCGGVLAHAKNAPLLLTSPGCESSASGYIKASGITAGMVLGGDGLISDNSALGIFHTESITVK